MAIGTCYVCVSVAGAPQCYLHCMAWWCNLDYGKCGSVLIQERQTYQFAHVFSQNYPIEDACSVLVWLSETEG